MTLIIVGLIATFAGIFIYGQGAMYRAWIDSLMICVGLLLSMGGLVMFALGLSALGNPSGV